MLIFLITSCTVVYALDPNDAVTAIQTAETALTSTFQNVLKADSVGANVSNLVLTLNEAVVFLELAQDALKKGMLNEALNLTQHSIRLIEATNSESIHLRSSILAQIDSTFRFNLILTIIAISSYCIILFFVWPWFKHHFRNKVVGLTSEGSKRC